MDIKEAVYGLKQDIYNLKDFLTDTEKQKWQEALETVLAELEKKDKIILKMAKFINYVDIDELICKNVKCDEYESIEKCEQCIINFFKKKVSD